MFSFLSYLQQSRWVMYQWKRRRRVVVREDKATLEKPPLQYTEHKVGTWILCIPTYAAERVPASAFERIK